MKVVGYIRVSSKGQMDGDGPERQLQAIKKFCATHSLTLTKCYTDEGVSGTTEALDREAFSNMLIDIETTEFEAVVVERMDRLARDLMVSEILMRELRAKGIRLFAVDQGAPVDLASNEGDPTRKLIRQIFGALAEWEKSSLVLKLRVARQRSKARGGTPEGTKPYGHTQAEKVVLDLIKLWRSQGFTTKCVADFLNDGSFRTRKGTLWTRQNILGILKNHKPERVDK